MVKEIEDLRISILDTQQEIDKLQEETSSKTFMQQLSKELEQLYLSKKVAKPAVAVKKSIKLKSIAKDAQAKGPEEAHKGKEEQKLQHKHSKVHKLRAAVSEAKRK
eukprot:TRINITY_DN5548_c0_g1_i1.p3 TRINITY_DN5548_c0_g1~~TRINITY_DN5548_c0_g1_i1.p3  ORF type:complete len:106 (+),score=39.48 TRINITY_DN5548_c0_g1_i1:724-1041(+)